MIAVEDRRPLLLRNREQAPASWYALECVFAPVLELDPRASDKDRHGSGREEFAGGGVVQYSGGHVDADPSDVFAPELDLAGMQASPDPDAQRSQRVPDRACTPYGAAGPVEGGQHAITGEFDQSAPMLIDDGSDHRVVTVEEAAPPMVSDCGGVLG